MAKYDITGERPKTRRDHAADSFYGAVYNEIAANAGLDTRWGAVAARAASIVARELVAGVPVGWAASIDVGPYRDTVTVTRES